MQRMNAAFDPTNGSYSIDPTSPARTRPAHVPGTSSADTESIPAVRGRPRISPPDLPQRVQSPWRRELNVIGTSTVGECCDLVGGI